MPGRGTPKFGIRVSERLWQRLGEVAAAAGTDRSTVLREFIAWYVREDRSKLPTRP
jgi:hypothetical protein